jgi:thiamine biosynthesis lipoprotein
MWLLWWILGSMLSSEDETLHLLSGKAQGTTFSIQYVWKDSMVSLKEIDSIFGVIDASLSLYKQESLISQFNRDGRVKMDIHMQRVMQSALEVYAMSGGRFDVTVRQLTLLWKEHQEPSGRTLREARNLTGSRFLAIKGDSLLATRKGLQIDCNGIAQGYTVDVLVEFLRQKGIMHLMIELGGEIRTLGMGPGGREWRIGLESPMGGSANYYPVDRVIALWGEAVTTSANYRQPRHIIDPLRGKPVSNGMVSVTVIAKDAMTADAWDNAFFVMGWKDALASVKQDTSLAIYMVYQDKQGRYRDTSSPGFKHYLR